MAEVDLTGQLATAMITLYRGDAKRIQHFMKPLEFPLEYLHK